MRAWLVALAVLCSSCGHPAYAQVCETESVDQAMAQITAGKIQWVAIKGEKFKKLLAVMKAELGDGPNYDAAESFLAIVLDGDVRVGFIRAGCVFQVLVMAQEDFLAMTDQAFGSTF